MENYNLKELRSINQQYQNHEMKIKDYLRMIKVAIKDQKLNTKTLKSGGTKVEIQESKFRTKILKKRRKRAKKVLKELKKMISGNESVIKALQNKNFLKIWNKEVINQLNDLLAEIDSNQNDDAKPSEESNASQTVNDVSTPPATQSDPLPKNEETVSSPNYDGSDPYTNNSNPE